MKNAVCVDLGGTFIKFALISEQGEVLYKGKIPSKGDESAEAVLEQIKTTIRSCIEFAKENSKECHGIGIGSPGVVDDSHRVVYGSAGNIVDWNDIHMGDMMEKEFHLPTFVDNDANLMGLGEVKFGAAVGCIDVVFLTVGTGIGGALYIHGRLFGGYKNRGTELGHTPLFADGLTCSCGSAGCLEAYASVTALIKNYMQKCIEQQVVLEHEVTGRLIVSLYHQSDPIAVICMNEHFFSLGRGIAGFINIFSPQRVVIGGGISEAGDFYIDRVSEIAMKYSIDACNVNTKIVPAKLGNMAGCYGAASFVFSRI